MPNYLCRIGTSDGRIVDKHYESDSREQLRSSLEGQGFHVFRIRRYSLGFFNAFKPTRRRLSGARLLAFNQELLVLLRSGVPVMQIFDTQVEQLEAGALREVISEVREEVRSGSSLSEAFAKFPHFFPPLYIAALRAGEKTGNVPETLSRFLTYQKRVERIRDKVRGATFYPLLLTCAAVFVVIFLILFVVPRFSEIYADANVSLPLMTRLLMTLSRNAIQFWYLLPFAVLVLVGIARLVNNAPSGRLWLDRVRLQLPFIGGLTIDYALSSFGRTLGTTLVSGTPLVEAMRMSRGTLNNCALGQEMMASIRCIEEGVTMSEALGRSGFFPPMALRMIRVGETSGSLTEMLADLADYYESRVEERLDRLTTMIEPVLMMVMGLLIAFIIVAMYVPIFQLAGTVG
ncbi:type II secretion system F family protein [uncultured Desulfuromonas sp.]|uniref:type II secretion system F family protein n=1 Tax=uncultured Desulfuromonas sp. TaxID=181013 RepID=UPI002AABF208|nr:type II secretion system F family protein [uncultured Desulfuromonas sp.]